MSISFSIRCLSLVVRRWCRAFLFDPLSMEEDFAEDVCHLVDVLRILRKSRVWRSHPVSHQSSHWSPFRVCLANVPHLQKLAHIRCRDELFAELVHFRQPCPSAISRPLPSWARGISFFPLRQSSDHLPLTTWGCVPRRLRTCRQLCSRHGWVEESLTLSGVSTRPCCGK